MEPEPALAPAPTSLLAPADSSPGAAIARRLLQACDYWIPQATSADDSLTLRKGLYQSRQGQRVMVLPRSTWTVLSLADRRALAAYLRQSGEAEAIQVGDPRPATTFSGTTLEPEKAVWTAAHPTVLGE